MIEPKGTDMTYLIGTLLALATGGFATLVGFDRSRSFYPVVLIVIASYYCLFAVMGGSSTALWSDATVAGVFAAAAVIGFRTSLWLVVVALAGHGVMDLFHHHLIENAGVPVWWAAFCSSFDLAAALYLALRIKRQRAPD
jgi:hypothetical protein